MDLVVEDLVIEYTSGDYTLRPVDHLSFEGAERVVGVVARAERVRQVDVAVVSRRHPDADERFRLGRRRSHVGSERYGVDRLPAIDGRHRVPVVQPRAQPHRDRERDGAAARRRRSDAQTRHKRAAACSTKCRCPIAPATSRELSGGQQQRVAIARALAHEPPIVLADEPTAHLDYVQVEAVLRLIRSLAKPGRSVIVATHDERMLPLADVVVEMLPKFVEGADKPESSRSTRARSYSSRAASAARSTSSTPVTSRSCATMPSCRQHSPANTSARWARCSTCRARRRPAPAKGRQADRLHAAAIRRHRRARNARRRARQAPSAAAKSPPPRSGPGEEEGGCARRRPLPRRKLRRTKAAAKKAPPRR